MSEIVSKEEKQLLAQHFRGNDGLLKLLRKIFVTPFNFDAPIGQATDSLISGVNFADLPAEEAKIRILARQESLGVLDRGLIQIQFLANDKEKTPDELEKERNKNSAK